ncbi:MAG: hypothetical protein DI573_00380 [Microbacterium sp.]|nr:MAG: hypothetical protein DI573_00380 [Microbacterium sp.]
MASNTDSSARSNDTPEARYNPATPCATCPETTRNTPIKRRQYASNAKKQTERKLVPVRKRHPRGSLYDQRHLAPHRNLHQTQKGALFAFVGRQVHVEIDGDDFYIDLLFFHVEQLRYVVVELKTTKFTPADAGQLGFYVAVVDDLYRIREKHLPTLGILLVAGKNDTVVRYALASTTSPVAVSRYQLDEADQKALPDEAAITRAFADELARDAGDE